MLLAELVATSRAVAQTRARGAKVAALAECLRRLEQDERNTAIAWLSGELPQGRLGVGYAALGGGDSPAAAAASLTLQEVAHLLRQLAATGGPGSRQRRSELLRNLMHRATAEEQQFLRRLLLQELRQGALEGIMVEAVAAAGGAPPAAVRRALLVGGSLPAVGAALLGAGEAALGQFRLTLFRPLQPMLAQTAPDVGTALERTGAASVEIKYDGARIQVHRAGDRVEVYTRNLRELSANLPEVVASVARLPVRQVILDGEVIALRADGSPRPFQVTMSRFGRRQGVARAVDSLPLSPFFFDCLHLDGADLIDRPLSERLGALDAACPPGLRVPRLTTADPEQAQCQAAQARASGHEGVMIKSLASPYEAGRRGAGWLKVKPAHTFDLVVVAVEWGSGRRRGHLSNLHLAARDAEHGGFAMVGKTFKGLTDALLRWQTQRFLGLETHRRGHVVHVRPEQVVEVACDGIQTSSRYASGMALRFARVKGYREDKPAAAADTVATLRALQHRARDDG